MVANLFVESSSSTTVNLSPQSNTYIIDAAVGTTYTYNLPSITCDGQEFTLIRIDATTGIVNLLGAMDINGTSISTFKIYPRSTVVVISLNGIWQITCSENTSPDSTNIVFNTYFNKDINTPYLSVNTSFIVIFPFLGISNYATISTIVIAFANPTPSCSIRLVRSGGVTVATISVPVSSTSISYNLTGTQKNNLSSGPDYMSLQFTGTSVDISSISLYS